MKIKFILLTGFISLGLMGCESTQQSLKSWWADTEGVHRKAYIYNQFNKEPLMVVEDKEMRTERKKEYPNSILVWSGSTNKATIIHNGVVIIQDQ